MSDLNLQGKRAVITGAAGGLGRAFAEGFAKAGAEVLVADINAEGCAETVALIEAAGGKAHATSVDVTDRESCIALARTAETTLGGVDVLVNNAAIYAGLERRTLEDIDEVVWDRVMAVNVKGVWQVSRALTPVMRKGGGGAIVNVSSATVFSGSPQWLHYVASKGAVIAMSRAMARELGDHRIRVNTVVPGWIMTQRQKDLWVTPEALAKQIDRQCLPDPIDPVYVARMVLFLASNDAAMCSAGNFMVEGGSI